MNGALFVPSSHYDALWCWDEYVVREESYHLDSSRTCQNHPMLRLSLVPLDSCISRVGSRDDHQHEVD